MLEISNRQRGFVVFPHREIVSALPFSRIARHDDGVAPISSEVVLAAGGGRVEGREEEGRGPASAIPQKPFVMSLSLSLSVLGNVVTRRSRQSLDPSLSVSLAPARTLERPFSLEVKGGGREERNFRAENGKVSRRPLRQRRDSQWRPDGGDFPSRARAFTIFQD